MLVLTTVLMTLCIISPVSAQSTDIDTDAPVLEEILINSEPGARHRFWARVVDNVTVERVVLSYRLGNETAYHKLPMPLSEQADWFYTELDEDIPSDSVIDYYIQAVDASGNPTQQGYKYNPALSSEKQSVAAAATEQTPGSKTSAKNGVLGTSISGRTVLYGVLGVLAVGAVAGGLNSETTPGNPPECCLLTITAPTL